jgi:hypothetical protein
MLEGINNFVLYHKAVREFFKFLDMLPLDKPSTPITNALIGSLNATINSFKFPDTKAADSLPDVYAALGNLTTDSLGSQTKAVDNLLATVLTAVLQKFNFEATEPSEADSSENPTKSVLSVIALIYKYFFASSGMVVLLLAVFVWFVRREKDIYDRIAIGVRIVGAFILFVCTFFVFSKSLVLLYLKGPMILPTVLLVLVLSEFFLFLFFNFVCMRC